MEKEKTTDSPDICRICLKNGKSQVSIFDFHDTLQYHQKVMHCVKIQISELDGYPQSICGECQSELTVAYDFVVKCQVSDECLRNAFVPPADDVKSETTTFDDVAIKMEMGSDNDNDSCRDEILEEYRVKKEKKLKKSKKLRRTIKKSKKKRRSAPKREFKCDTCGLATAGRSALIIHMRKHTGERPYKCPTCDSCFSHLGTLKMHIKRLHLDDKTSKEREFSCEICGKLFISRRDVVIHFRLHTGEKPYACDFCPKTYRQMGSLTVHRRTHTGERPYPCTICGKAFIDAPLLKLHLLVHSEERQYTCNICGKSVKAKQTLIKHLNLHKDFKPVICDQCGAVFSTKGNLSCHKRTFHTEKSGRCSVCSKQCADLTQHMRRHTGEDVFTCKICNKRFNQSGSLTRHMSNHANADKYKCDKPDCSKAFRHKYLLDYHVLKYHSNIIPFSCKICNKGFLRNCDLKIHAASHLTNNMPPLVPIQHNLTNEIPPLDLNQQQT